jgi:hypothetical protein
MQSKVSFCLILFSAMTLSGLANACPLTTLPGTYTELSLACTITSSDGTQAAPDRTQPVALNQPTAGGGECRVEAANGDVFFLQGQDVVLENSANQVLKHVGVLSEVPHCYQTDTGGDFYSGWYSVRLDP